MAFRALTGLWHHPDFMKLWLGQTISGFGSRITRDALPLVAVITLSASPAEMGLLTAAASLPVLVFSLFAGVWIDRIRRRPVMIAADVGSLLVLLLIPWAALGGWLRIELLYLVAAITGLLTLIYEIAYRAVLPSLIDRRDLLEGNTKLAITDSLAEIGGPSLAGLLVQIISAPLAILFDALSFLLSAISIALIRQPEPLPQPHPAGRNIWREMLEGWQFIAREPVLRTLVIGLSIRAFFGTFYAVLYSLFLVRDLGLSPAQLGLVISGGGIGALAGSLLATRITRRFGLGRTLLLMLAVGSVLNLHIPLIGGPVWWMLIVLTAGQILGDGLWSIYEINEMVLRQSIVPDRLLGRVNSSIGFLAQGVASFGALIGGALATSLGARPVLFIACAGIMVGSLYVIASPVRQLETQPEAQPL